MNPARVSTLGGHKVAHLQSQSQARVMAAGQYTDQAYCRKIQLPFILSIKGPAGLDGNNACHAAPCTGAKVPGSTSLLPLLLLRVLPRNMLTQYQCWEGRSGVTAVDGVAIWGRERKNQKAGGLDWFSEDVWKDSIMARGRPHAMYRCGKEDRRRQAPNKLAESLQQGQWVD